MQFSFTSFAKPVVTQRRFRILLIALVLFSVMLGLLIVPFEQDARFTRIHSWGDGLWWSVITVTGVGYGDVIPVTPMGRIIGSILSVVGVLGFSLIIAMFGLALSETRDRYYRMKLFEKLDAIEERMDRLEKNSDYMLQNDLKNLKRKTEEDNPPL